MEKLLERAMLTATAEIKVVRTDGQVDSMDTVGALTVLHRCSTTMMGSSAQLDLVLQYRCAIPSRPKLNLVLRQERSGLWPALSLHCLTPG